MIRRAQDLDPVLARVAGAADQALRAGDVDRGGAKARGELAGRQPLDDAARLGPLHGEHRPVGEPVLDLAVEVGGVLGEPLEVALVVGGVRDGQEALVGEAVGEEVVQDAAVLAAEHRVLGAADVDLRDVVREHALQQVRGARPRGLDLAHVRDVEDAATRADGQVLGPDPLVLDGHLPPGERNEPRARRLVGVEKGRAAKVRHPPQASA